jgi:polysaccharide deacetylase 2 family uncharacterized protein YibQ
MATQSSKSTIKPKTPRRKHSAKTSNFKKHLIVFLSVFLMISFTAFGYFLGNNDNSSTIVQNHPTNQTAVQTNVEVPKKKVANNDNKNTKDVALAYRGKMPKLVIIIDDVANAKQLARIRSLPIKVTPSIFPPYEFSKSNHTLAQGLEHYMIHLPMQSGKSYDKQYGTLMITDSKEKIEARVKELRRLFPGARYVNNHTGSVFTNNYKVMKILYAALRNEGFVFVDSLTTERTAVQKIAHDFGDAYVARDIFMDNKKNIPYIHAQLKKAVQNAKKNGYAIAIGHPHNTTMKALESAKDIFDEVELVYIDEIYIKGK